VNHAAWLEVIEEALATAAPEQLAATRRRIRLEYLAVTEGTCALVQISQQPGASDLRVDVRDEHGVALLRGLFTVSR
jgi:hypothetical protein